MTTLFNSYEYAQLTITVINISIDRDLLSCHGVIINISSTQYYFSTEYYIVLSRRISRGIGTLHLDRYFVVIYELINIFQVWRQCFYTYGGNG